MIKNKIENTKIRLYKSTSSYVLNNPNILYLQKQETFKNIYMRLNKEISIILTNKKTELFQLENSYVLNNPDILYKFHQQNLNSLIEKLTVLNPMNTLKRGYAIVKENNHVISTIAKVKQKQEININLKDGEIIAKVLEVREENG